MRGCERVLKAPVTLKAVQTLFRPDRIYPLLTADYPISKIIAFKLKLADPILKNQSHLWVNSIITPRKLIALISFNYSKDREYRRMQVHAIYSTTLQAMPKLFLVQNSIHNKP